MALTVGGTTPGSTTLASLVDLVWANKTAALTGASAVFTALEPNRIVISWPTYNDVCYMVFVAHPISPETIAL